MKMPKIAVYTFRADKSVKIGYPEGWVVGEHKMGASIVEHADPGCAGIEFLVGQLKGDVKTNKDFADMMFKVLRQKIPTLKTIKEGAHPNAKMLWIIDAKFSSDGTNYLAHVLTMVNPKNKIGIFVAFSLDDSNGHYNRP